jgi:hypothetical protein
MKIHCARDQASGSALVVALVFAAVLGVSLVALLSWACTQNHLIMRSQCWNRALPLAEAGLEEAMAHLWLCPSNRAQNGWAFQDGFYTKTRQLGEGYYVVQIDTNAPPVVIAEGFAKAPLQVNQYISRKVRVTTTDFPVYYGGIVVDREIELNGNGIYVDSYDSTDPLSSTLGLYDQSKKRANGHVASNYGVKDSINIGNANIFGKVSTAPGGSIDTGPLGVVGSLAWQAAGNKGIQPGWSSSDFNMLLEPVPGPAPGSGLVPAGGSIPGEGDFDYILTDGLWHLDSLEGRIYVAGNATLVVSGDSKFGDASDAMKIAAGASLKMWSYGESVSISSDAIKNVNGTPDTFHYYGGPDQKSLTLTGNVKFDGLVNAPSADMKLGGGGSVTFNMSGAIIARSVTMDGHVNMHYDESLTRKYFKGYVVTSWTEL